MKLNQDDPIKKYKRPESVLVVVYTRTGKVLMLRRADHPEFWQSVTGSLEWDDENLAATAKRELREETGLTADGLRDWEKTNRYVIFPQWRYKYAPEVSENTEHVFSVEIPAEITVTLNPAEHDEYKWMDFNEAAERATSGSNRDAILALMTMLTKGRQAGEGS
jgi:dihydroneopterin triphosphate diphosphatase